jgi:1-acyl-sn-glycerol-3-phosphate acyltransferase
VILIRSTLFNIAFFAISFCLTVPGAVARLINPDWVTGFAVLWARSMVVCLRIICGIRVEVTGQEHLPVGAALIASRHQSAFDTFIWLTLLPRCCYVLKHELLRIPLFGGLIAATRMIAVDRSGGSTTMRMLMREGKRAMREERQIVIFPEGTRADFGKTLPLLPGVAALASSTGLPIIPVITDSGLCWGRRAFRKLPGTIHIRILPPIPPGLRRDALMARLAEDLAGANRASPEDPACRDAKHDRAA